MSKHKRFIIEKTGSGRWAVIDTHHRFYGGLVICVEYTEAKAQHKRDRMQEAHETAQRKRRLTTSKHKRFAKQMTRPPKGD